ncbi:MAG: MarR family transcriptional regulator [Brevinematales bacterium]|nr:MarR family transcriptional regulator [Brevinematales bacterium]
MLFPMTGLPHLFEMVAITYTATRRLVSDRLAPYGITYPQWGALYGLYGHDGMRQVELAKLIGIDTTNAMVICDGLSKKGWIARENDPSDRRANILRMTAEGRALMDRTLAVVAGLYSDAAGDISETEADIASGVLERFLKMVKEKSDE